MHKRLLLVGVVVALIGLGGCSARARAVATTTTTVPATTTTTMPATSNSTAGSQQLTIAVSAQLSSDGQDPSILLPASCTLQGGTVTAMGTFNGGFVPETYVRFGDVVELYVFTGPSPGYPQGNQVAALGVEHPFNMSQPGPWKVSVSVGDSTQPGPDAPQQCEVAVQATHAFMGAGNAGG